jgi:hypothetical protein
MRFIAGEGPSLLDISFVKDRLYKNISEAMEFVKEQEAMFQRNPEAFDVKTYRKFLDSKIREMTDFLEETLGSNEGK